MNVAHLRRHYAQASLDRQDLAANPLTQFERWFQQAQKSKLLEANAMTLSTVGRKARPSSRIVLLKSFDNDGLVFFTNFESRKAQEIAENPRVALLFAWLPLERQVSVEGRVRKVTANESAEYFAQRPYGNQLGAWVSAQSSVITTRGELERKLAKLQKQFPEGQVPPPPFWGGFRVTPDTWEFWQGRLNRLHDRFRYHKKSTGGWKIERLSP
jgi:pyridoxamine 5'-phosphate oxidase